MNQLHLEFLRDTGKQPGNTTDLFELYFKDLISSETREEMEKFEHLFSKYSQAYTEWLENKLNTIN